MTRRDEGAVASLLSYGVAGIIFVASLAALLVATQAFEARPRDDDPGNRLEAQAVLDALARSEGTGWEGDATWTDATPDPWDARPGLASGTQGVLDADRMATLARSPRAAAADAWLNYDEAVEALGLNDLTGGATLAADLELGFHIRTEPVLAAVLPAVNVANAIYVRSGPPGLACLTPDSEQTMLNNVLDPDPVCVADNPGVGCMTGSALTDLLAALAATPPSILVIGSGMDHGCLSSAVGFPDAARDWLENGGDIVVLGSDTADQAVWLETVFDQDGDNDVDADDITFSSSHSLRDPDLFHPMLRIPNALATGSYAPDPGDTDLALGAAAGGFVTLSYDGPDPLVRLAVPGTFGPGTGRIVAADLRPVDYTDDACDADGPSASVAAAEVEGECLFQNVLFGAYPQLFLDYGSAIPDDVEARPAEALLQVADPTGGDLAPTGLADVPVHVRVYVFTEYRD